MEKHQRMTLADPDEFGFGTKAMKRVKICRSCGSTEAVSSYICTKCRTRLPVQTLYQIYQQKHDSCPLCDTVLASYMRYCPHCGMLIKQTE